MPDLYPLARQLLWRLQPETAHNVALHALKAGLGFLSTNKQARGPDSPILKQSLWGLTFHNPVGVAAGFDKDALVPNEILRLGFGAVEVGTVTPQPQGGYDKPRVFRLDQDNSIINRMGFPSAGLDVVAKRLASRRKEAGILGVNLGKNRDTEIASLDYTEALRRIAPLADYLVVNISSPNTPGLRDLQRRAPLEALLTALMGEREKAEHRPPLLIKIAPDLSEEERADIAAVALDTNIDGIIIANTTTTRPKLAAGVGRPLGGLSGPPLFELSTELLSDMYRLTSGRLPLVGVGGVSSAEDAYAKIRAGASLVQIHSALIFKGMGLVGQIKAGLVKMLTADGFANITDAVGADHRDGGQRTRRSGATVHDFPQSRGYEMPHLPALSSGKLATSA
jgi:dihydroorotate dehydrogenase